MRGLVAERLLVGTKDARLTIVVAHVDGQIGFRTVVDGRGRCVYEDLQFSHGCVGGAPNGG